MSDSKFRALRVLEKGGYFHTEIQEQSLDDLPDNDVLVKVKYSSLNFKDALSAHGHKGVTRQFPHTPGIDAAGVVVESRSPELKPGQEVIVTGYDLGMNTPGGFGEYIRVPVEWCVVKPPNHDLHYFMTLGTAGLTAGLSVDRLSQTVAADDGEVLVTGSTGGVGCLAVALLARLGYDTVALTSKVDHSDLLAKLGARRVLDRSHLEEMPEKALMKETWAGVVDTVGGALFSKILKTVKHSGAATTCGMVAGTELTTSIFPFILRGVTLYGIDSVEISRERKRHIWEKLDSDWALPDLKFLAQDVVLEELPGVIEKIYCGKMLGRAVLRHIDQE
ncbi:NADPH:quinone reductase and related Zn-dependent oxidoreductase [Hahella chejuensis KCTC 2396]|uniref:NADPH:quinone reductase and related Zn-dependent oxidoreductase n=1 Tax=Hahella chejuensis (strain KCTC 2396) TaxID=349521 RepID=Q2SJ38_HAHCH|nr:YhdH/YhfP family quinone oxidoreductase [Hahella chejuensis]ABC29336.1 NADPH:quinone reductase and related Zn-dependent oxidoreductase [Hahella chejuensis KCTC 2396]